MEVLSEEIVHAATRVTPQHIQFSPLDLFAGGHLPVGPLYGFTAPIDHVRFHHCLQQALTDNPEMGVAVQVFDGIHVMETGHGVEFVVQRCDEPLPPATSIAGLPLDRYPLAYSPLMPTDLVDQALPLLGFRITHFADGGCILGIRTTHSHVDGASLTRLLLNLSARYRGTTPAPPCSGRSLVTALACGPGERPSAAFPVAPGHTDAALLFAQNAALQLEASRTALPDAALRRYVDGVQQEHPVSSSDVLNALVWKAWSQVAPAGDDERAQLYGVFDLRRAGLGLPADLQGNALLDRAASLPFGTVRSAPIPVIARAFREQIKPLRAQDVIDDIAFLARLQRQRRYGRDGMLNGFQRNLYNDLARRAGLFVNDIRRIPTDHVRFGERASWFEQGQGHARGFATLTQQGEHIIVRYDDCGDETRHFVAALQNILKKDLRIA